MAPDLFRKSVLRKFPVGAVLVFSLAGFVIGASYLLKLIPVFHNGQPGESFTPPNGELMQIDQKYWKVSPVAYRIPRPPCDLNYGRVSVPQTQIDPSGQCVQSEVLKQMAHTQGRQTSTAPLLKRTVQTIRSWLSSIVNQLVWMASHMGRFPVFVRTTPLMVRMVR